MAGQQQQPDNRVTILAPDSVPCKGMRSSVQPGSLPAGYYAFLQNWRFDKAAPYVRNGASLISAAPIANATAFRGAWHGYIRNVEYLFAAFDISTFGPKVALYSLNLSTMAWSEITVSGTRMTTALNCTFAAGQSWVGNDGVVVQNGTDSPRVILPYAATKVGINQPFVVTGPLSSTGWLQMANGADSVFKGYPYAGGSWVNSAAGQFKVDTGTGVYGATATIMSIIATGAGTATLTTGNGLVQNDISQIVILANGTTNPWNAIKVEMIDSAANATVVYDPTSTSTNFQPAFLPNVDPANASTYAVIYQPPSTFAVPTNAVVKLRFTYTGATPAATYTTEILSVIIDGGVATDLVMPGTGTLGFTFIENTATSGQSESAGYIISNYLTDQGYKFVGMPAATWSMPNSPLLKFRASVKISATAIVPTPFYASFYYQAPGAIQYSWLGASGFASASATGVAFAVIGGFTTTINTAITLPDGYTTTIPIGAYVFSSGNRLYVGGAGVGQNQLWFSWANSTFRFRSQVAFLAPGIPDQTSGGVDLFPGETVTGISKIGGHNIGIDPIIIFTNVSVFRIDGLNTTALSRPTRIAQHGLPFPNAYTERLGILYWVDEERQVVRMAGGQLQQISLYKVEDKIATATMTNACMAVLGNRVYLAYGNQQTALVHETLLNEWTSDLWPFAAAGLLTINDSTIRKVYAFDNAGNIYRLETPGQNTDAGTAIATSMTTRQYHDPAGMYNVVRCGPVSLAIDSASATVLTITRTWLDETPGQDGTINLAATVGSIAWLEEGIAPGLIKAGGTGLAVQVGITGNLLAGTNMYGASMEFGSDMQVGPSVGVLQ